LKIREIKLEHVKAWASKREMEAGMFYSAEIEHFNNEDDPAVQRAIRMEKTFGEIRLLLDTLEF
jgi:hypothetical protein